MGVKLLASSGGSVELVPTNTASNFTVTVPAGTGTVAVNGVSSSIVSGTAQASTSGTSINFTGIPSWVKRITVMFSGVSTSGTSPIQMQLGAGSPVTTGYNGSASYISVNTVSQATVTTGLQVVNAVSAASAYSGAATITLLGSNLWCMTSNLSAHVSMQALFLASTALSLGGTLDRVRITTVNGTDTFDAGSINILYE